jgi:N-acetylmuramic acid 6-phosphate etherase
MISTTTMIRLGRVKGNKMVDMQLSNIKLVARAVNMVMQATKLDEKTAQSLLNQYGSVRKAVENAPSN